MQMGSDFKTHIRKFKQKERVFTPNKILIIDNLNEKIHSVEWIFNMVSYIWLQ